VVSETGAEKGEFLDRSVVRCARVLEGIIERGVSFRLWSVWERRGDAFTSVHRGGVGQVFIYLFDLPRAGPVAHLALEPRGGALFRDAFLQTAVRPTEDEVLAVCVG